MAKKRVEVKPAPGYLPPFHGMYIDGDNSAIPPNQFRLLENIRHTTDWDIVVRPGVEGLATGVVAAVDGFYEAGDVGKRQEEIYVAPPPPPPPPLPIGECLIPLVGALAADTLLIHVFVDYAMNSAPAAVLVYSPPTIPYLRTFDIIERNKGARQVIGAGMVQHSPDMLLAGTGKLSSGFDDSVDRYTRLTVLPSGTVLETFPFASYATVLRRSQRYVRQVVRANDGKYWLAGGAEVGAEAFNYEVPYRYDFLQHVDAAAVLHKYDPVADAAVSEYMPYVATRTGDWADWVPKIIHMPGFDVCAGEPVRWHSAVTNFLVNVPQGLLIVPFYYYEDTQLQGAGLETRQCTGVWERADTSGLYTFRKNSIIHMGYLEQASAAAEYGGACYIGTQTFATDDATWEGDLVTDSYNWSDRLKGAYSRAATPPYHAWTTQTARILIHTWGTGSLPIHDLGVPAIIFRMEKLGGLLLYLWHRLSDGTMFLGKYDGTTWNDTWLTVYSGLRATGSCWFQSVWGSVQDPLATASWVSFSSRVTLGYSSIGDATYSGGAGAVGGAIRRSPAHAACNIVKYRGSYVVGFTYRYQHPTDLTNMSNKRVGGVFLVSPTTGVSTPLSLDPNHVYCVDGDPGDVFTIPNTAVPVATGFGVFMPGATSENNT